MSKPQRTPDGKWRIYHAETGQAIERWPVDARGMLEHGYVAEPPTGAAPLAPVSPKDRGLVENPEARFPKDVRGEGRTREEADAAAEAGRYVLVQSGSWWKVVDDTTGEQVGKSQRTEEAALALIPENEGGDDAAGSES